jgi:hypothetical protein
VVDVPAPKVVPVLIRNESTSLTPLGVSMVIQKIFPVTGKAT